MRLSRVFIQGSQTSRILCQVSKVNVSIRMQMLESIEDLRVHILAVFCFYPVRH